MATVVSKRYDAAVAKVDAQKPYTVEEAIATLQSMPAAKFDESVDLSFRLGVDPKHADQMVRDAGPDGPGGPSRQGARPAWADAESEARHGDVRRGPRRPRGEGRQGRVPRRQGGQHPC